MNFWSFQWSKILQKFFSNKNSKGWERNERNRTERRERNDFDWMGTEQNITKMNLKMRSDRMRTWTLKKTDEMRTEQNDSRFLNFPIIWYCEALCNKGPCGEKIECQNQAKSNVWFFFSTRSLITQRLTFLYSNAHWQLTFSFLWHVWSILFSLK